MTQADSIARSVLMTDELPIHYYLSALHLVLKFVREMGMDVYGDIYTERLTVDKFGEADLPDRYIDWIRVGVPNGRHIVPLGINTSFSRLPNLDDAGDQIEYESGTVQTPFGAAGYTWELAYNDYGENLGKQYGLSGSARTDEFKVIPEKNKVYVGKSVPAGGTVYMEYLADSIPSAQTYVHPYAEAAAEAYARWQMATRARFATRSEEDRRRRDYGKEMAKLRARINSITKEDITRLYRANIIQTVKG